MQLNVKAKVTCLSCANTEKVVYILKNVSRNKNEMHMQCMYIINCDGEKLLLFTFMLLLQKWEIAFFSAIL